MESKAPTVHIRALLIEDDLDAARLVRRRLEWSPRAKFEVGHETTFSGALEKLEKEAWDVVILDLGLPDIEGLSTVAHASIVTRSLPVVILTSNADDGLAIQSVRAGFEDFLIKDEQDGATLVRAVLHAIERHAGVGAAEPATERHEARA